MPSKNHKTQRIWEIDFLRALAVLGMICFHVLYILDFWDIKKTALFEGGWEFFGNTIRNLFFLLVGVGMVLSYQRHKASKKPSKEYYLKQLKKGGILIGIGLILTVLSLHFIPDQPIRFGVLSFIGSSMILLLPFIRSIRLLVLVVFLVLGAEYVLRDLWSHESFWSYILGFYPRYWPSVDYFSLIPWMSAVAMGALLGHVFFQESQRRYQFWTDSPKAIQPINWVGQKALWIYLLHLPVILLILWAVLKIGE